MLADQLDLPVHLHTARDRAGSRASRCEKHGQRPLARLDRLGLVNDRLIAVHMTQLTDAEIAPVRRARRQRGALPGIQPQARLGLLPGLRSCSAPASTSPSAPTAAPATTTSTCSARCAPPRCWPRPWPTMPPRSTPPRALRAATLGGATRDRASTHLIGSIEPGKQADLVCVDLSTLETQPLHHVVSQLVYASGRHQVSDVWIAGQRASCASACWSTWTSTAIVANARQWRDRIAARADGECAPMHDDQRRDGQLPPGRARQVRRAGPPLVGSGRPAEGAARAESGAPGLRRRARRTARRARARRRLRRRPAQRGAGAARARRSPRIDLAPELVKVARLHGLESGVQGRLPPAVGRGAGRGSARHVRRDHLHGDARARARSGRRSSPPARRCSSPAAACSCPRSTARRPRSRWRSSAPNTSRACCPRARTSTATSSSRPNWPRGCARPGCSWRTSAA